MFRGQSTLSLDAKGRMSVPKKYRDKLLSSCDGQLVITIEQLQDELRCLLIYPLPTWEKVETELTEVSSVDHDARGLLRMLVGHAEDCVMDAQGRVLLPGQLREFANLKKKITLVGQLNKLELWNEQSWNEQQEQWLEAQKADPDKLARSGKIFY